MVVLVRKLKRARGLKKVTKKAFVKPAEPAVAAN